MTSLARLASAIVGFVALLALGCGGGTPAQLPHPGLPPPPPVDHHEAACGAKSLWTQDAAPIAPNLGTPQGKITAIEITGATGDARVKDAVRFSVGDAFDGAKAQDTLRRMWAIGEYDDVALDVSEKDGGVALRFRLTPFAALGQVFIEGDGEPGKNEELEKTLRTAAGDKYVARALAIVRLGFLSGLGKRGYMDASMTLTSAKNEDGAVDVCAVVKKGPLVTIDRVRIEGLVAVKEADLIGKLPTDGGKVNVAGGVIDGERIEQGAQEFAKLLAERGMPTSQITYDLQRKDDKVTLVFRVLEGPVFKLRRYEVVGDRIADAGAYQKLLKVKPKDLFNQTAILADKTAIEAFHTAKGRSDVVVVPESTLDPKAGTVDLVFRIVDPKKPAPAPKK